MTKTEFINHHQFDQQDTDTFHMFNPDNDEVYIVFNGSGEIIEEHGIESNKRIEATIVKYLDDLYQQEYQDIIEDNYQTNGVKPQDFF